MFKQLLVTTLSFGFVCGSCAYTVDLENARKEKLVQLMSRDLHNAHLKVLLSRGVAVIGAMTTVASWSFLILSNYFVKKDFGCNCLVNIDYLLMALFGGPALIWASVELGGDVEFNERWIKQEIKNLGLENDPELKDYL